MQNMLYRRECCRLCESRELTPVLNLTPTPPANEFVSKEQIGQKQQVYPLDIYYCEACHHAQLLDIVSPEILFKDYVYVSGTSAVFRTHFEQYASQANEELQLKNKDLVVDIGSNDGTLLRYFKSMNVRVLGIEPARDIALAANADGIKTINNFFSPNLAVELRKQHGPAKLVTANNVFAHIDDLDSVVAGIKKLLAPDGLFIFEVSYLVDVIQNTLFDTIYHEHLSYHSVQPLVSFFLKHDMELIRADRVDSHGGSLRGFVQFKGGPHNKHNSVSDRLEEERSLGLDSSVALMGFSEHINELRQEVTGMLDDLIRRGKKVAGYGAPAKSTTLMYHFGIQPDSLLYIVDDSPLKQGLFSPGLNIPILPSSALESDPVDCLFIFAWNFSKPIMEKMSSYKEGGGQFLVPLPKPILI